MDDNHIDNSRDNIKKKNKDKLKTKKFRKQNSNYYRKVDDNIIYDNENDLLSVRLKRGRNKNNQLEGRQNNSAAFNHDINIAKNMNNDIDINKSKVNQYKINAKKIRIAREKNKKYNNSNNSKIDKSNKSKSNIVQNLMDDFDQTMDEYTSIYDKNNTSVKGTKPIKSYKPKHSDSKPRLKSSKSKLTNSKLKSSRSNLKSSKIKIISNSRIRIKDNIDDQKHKRNITGNSNSLSHTSIIDNKNKNLNHSYIIQRNESNKINSSDARKIKVKGKITKDNNHKNKKISNLKEFNLGNFNHINSNIIKIKRSTTNAYNELKEEKLALYRGQIDYNNVSIKNVDESIQDLLINYKEKGYTLLKKSKAQFVFVKGPHTHYVELMKLGNGLLYFCVTKKI